VRNLGAPNNSTDETLVEFGNLSEQELSRQVALERERLFDIARADPKKNNVPDDVLRQDIHPLNDCYLSIQVHQDDPVRLEQERLRRLEGCTEVPLYVVVLESEEYWDITYNIFYEYNGATADICCIPLQTTAPSAGFHEADQEHVTMRIKKETQELVACFMSSHRELEGEWRYRGKMEEELGPGGAVHPKVYVALNSHSNYPSPGTKLRLLGFGNDYCDVTPSSLIWRPKVMLHLVDLDWSGYSGCFGSTGSGKTKGSVSGFDGLRPGEPPTNITPCARFWCCCYYPACCLIQGWFGGPLIFPGTASSGKTKPAREKQGNTIG